MRVAGTGRCTLGSEGDLCRPTPAARESPAAGVFSFHSTPRSFRDWRRGTQ